VCACCCCWCVCVNEINFAVDYLETVEMTTVISFVLGVSSSTLIVHKTAFKLTVDNVLKSSDLYCFPIFSHFRGYWSSYSLTNQMILLCFL